MTRSGEKQQIYYLDSTMKYVDRGTQFTDRVNGTISAGTVVLTINDVQVEDEVEFICLIKSLTEGAGEGRTKLKVFGKIQFELFILLLCSRFAWNLLITIASFPLRDTALFHATHFRFFLVFHWQK